MHRLAPVALCLAALAAPLDGRAGDVWLRPHAGVMHLHRTGGGVDVHVVRVDLREPTVALVATRPGDRFVTTREFARRYGAAVAINANFYHHGSCGLAMGAGETFADSYEDGCVASLAFGASNEAAAFDSTDLPRGPAPVAWAREVMTGKPWLVRDGRYVMAWQRPQHLYRPNPRSAAGITGDGRYLVLVAADGRRPGVQGMNGFQLASLFREFDVRDAVNLDGGGSTTLVVDGRVVNRPSDRAERRVVNHFGVRILAEARALRPANAPAAVAVAAAAPEPRRAPLALRAAAPTPPRREIARAGVGMGCDAAPGRGPSKRAWAALLAFGVMVQAIRRRAGVIAEGRGVR